MNPPPHDAIASPTASYSSGEGTRAGCLATQSWYSATGVAPSESPMRSARTAAASASAFSAHASGSMVARTLAMRISVGSGKGAGSANKPVVKPVEPGASAATSSAKALYRFSFLCESNRRQPRPSLASPSVTSRREPARRSLVRRLRASPPRSMVWTSRRTVAPGLPASARHRAQSSPRSTPCSTRGCASVAGVGGNRPTLDAFELAALTDKRRAASSACRRCAGDGAHAPVDGAARSGHTAAGNRDAIHAHLRIPETRATPGAGAAPAAAPTAAALM